MSETKRTPLPPPDEKAFTSLLNRTFTANGMGHLLSHERVEAFYRLTLHMLAENEKYNLTALTDPAGIVLRHYADCAALATRLPRGARIADVGCGAGFPTLPIAILRDDVTLLAIDATEKRVQYVRGAADLLGLTQVQTLCIRAEDAGRDGALRESFDIVTARAVAELRILCELCLPLVRVGGEMIAMKGKNAEYELSAAKHAIALLGGRASGVEEISLTGEGETCTHPLIRIRKAGKTPAAYPRPYAKISKRPL